MYLDEDGERITDTELVARIAELVDPAGLAGRLDLARPVRPHPGDRHRRSAAASSTSTTRAGASAATRRSSTTWSTSRARCPRCATVVEHDLALGDLSREQVLACAARLLDRGFFRIGSEELRGDERELRPGDDAASAT